MEGLQVVTLSLVFLDWSCYIKKAKYFGTIENFDQSWPLVYHLSHSE